MMPIEDTCSELEKFEKTTKAILLDIFNNRVQLRELVLQVPKNPTLFALCAHYDAVDKIVLWISDDQKMQLRLHIYSDRSYRPIESSQADIAQAHNHRWNFSSIILSGGYRHTIYRADPHCLIPGMIRQEKIGDCYTLHHTQYHSIIEQPNTVSLLIRGPIEKERFQVACEDASSLNTPEEENQKKMGDERYQMLVAKLVKLEVI